jgi:hypothetical protein
VAFDHDHELGEVAVATIRRNCCSATSMPAAVQRLRMSPSCQRFTLRCYSGRSRSCSRTGLSGESSPTTPTRSPSGPGETLRTALSTRATHHFLERRRPDRPAVPGFSQSASYSAASSYLLLQPTVRSRSELAEQPVGCGSRSIGHAADYGYSANPEDSLSTSLARLLTNPLDVKSPSSAVICATATSSDPECPSSRRSRLIRMPDGARPLGPPCG